MTAQQGVLLCKLFHEAAFSVTLMGMMFHKQPVRPVLRKLKIHTRYRREFLARLEELNVSKASLFPDLPEGHPAWKRATWQVVFEGTQPLR